MHHVPYLAKLSLMAKENITVDSQLIATLLRKRFWFINVDIDNLQLEKWIVKKRKFHLVDKIMYAIKIFKNKPFSIQYSTAGFGLFTKGPLKNESESKSTARLKSSGEEESSSL